MFTQQKTPSFDRKEKIFTSDKSDRGLTPTSRIYKKRRQNQTENPRTKIQETKV